VIPEIWEMMVEVMAHHAMTTAAPFASHSGRAYAHNRSSD
jgi:hypothetical protein